jgi:alpha-D-xyloside xylohydrolase
VSGLDAVKSVRAGAVVRGWAEEPLEAAVEERGDGVWVVRARAGDGARAVRLRLGFAPDEHVAGLGEQFTHVDKRGRDIDGWVGGKGQQRSTDTKGLDGGYKVAPLWYSSAGYAAFLTTTKRWRISFGAIEPLSILIDVPGGEAELFVVDGLPAQAIPKVTALIGRPAAAPAWSYGVWKNMRGGHDAIAAEAQRMRDEGVPCGAVWVDAHWQPGTNSGFPAAGRYPMGDYPDIAETAAALHGVGMKALTYVNPFLYKHTPAHDIAVEEGYAVMGPGDEPMYVTSVHPTHGDARGFLEQTGIHSLDEGNGLIDFTNPQAVAWFQSMLREILTEQGFDGWMQDFGEAVLPDARFADGTTGAESHNRYPLLYHQATADELSRTNPDAVFFVRSGYLGTGAIAPVHWPGDQTRDWSREGGIGAVPAAGVSAGLMGIAAWGPDAGGEMDFFSTGDGLGGGSEDKELWIRWVQLAAMSPVMRHHLGFHEGTPVDLWTDDETVEAWRRAGSWHLALHPYLLALAAEATATGLPLVRGLMVEFPDHAESWLIADEYLLGDALLCAPVLERGARTRRLWLPPGEWFDVWTGAARHGPGWVEVDAPLDRWPVLQRAGTAVPMLADVPLDVNDPVHASGAVALAVRVAPGPGRSVRTLVDGTTLVVEDGRLTVDAKAVPRWVEQTPDGREVAR